jgi:hypothetical protein
MKTPEAIICALYLIAVIINALKTYCDGAIDTWCLKRKLYFLCYSTIAIIVFFYELRIFIKNPAFNFYTQIALGAQFILLSLVPCGIEIFNKPWPIRRLRDLAFAATGISQIYSTLYH